MNVEVATSQGDQNSFPLELALSLQEGRYSGCSRSFDQDFMSLHQEQDGVNDLFVIDQHDVINQALDEREGDFSWLLDGNTIGDGGNVGQGLNGASF